jgi:hypothetical protein
MCRSTPIEFTQFYLKIPINLTFLNIFRKLKKPEEVPLRHRQTVELHPVPSMFI